jgi:hypothetical protein
MEEERPFDFALLSVFLTFQILNHLNDLYENCYECYAIGRQLNAINFDFLHPVITTGWNSRLVRPERHQR